MIDTETAIRAQQHYIAGDFRDGAGGRTFTTLNPTSNEVIVEVAAGDTADVDAAVAAARRAFDEGLWPRMSAKERAVVLRRIANLIREHAQEFIALECLDIGMPIAQMKGLAARAAENFDYFAGVIEELAGKAWQTGSFLNYSVFKPVAEMRPPLPSATRPERRCTDRPATTMRTARTADAKTTSNRLRPAAGQDRAESAILRLRKKAIRCADRGGDRDGDGEDEVDD